MKNKKKFTECMTMLGELFDKEISKTLQTVYWDILQPFDDERCVMAFNQVVKECKFFPKPVEILVFLQGTSEDKAVQAWALVDNAMRKTGNYESLDFGDPKIHQCIEILGGWSQLGTLTEDEWKWKRKEFESLYKALPEGQGPKSVSGFFELSNNTLPEKPETKIVKIGASHTQNLLNHG